MAHQKDPKRQLQGRQAKEKGRRFEARLNEAFTYYLERGFADVNKTPEPMRVTKNLGNGKFLAFYEKKAQPDYEGTIKGGRSVIFEAKFTDTDRMEQTRVTPEQAKYIDRKHRLGARCFVLAGFGSGEVYCIPWSVWTCMKELFGRKYVRETDLEKYRVPLARNNVLLIFS